MAKKKTTKYQPRTLVKPKDKQEVQIVERKIKHVSRIERNGIDVLEITTENGTRLQISQRDEVFNTSFSRWAILWKYLRKGDTIKIHHIAGKIVKSWVYVEQEFYDVSGFERTENEAILTLKNFEKELNIKISKADKYNIIVCVDNEIDSEFLFEAPVSHVMHRGVVLSNISQRNACIEFRD